MAYFTNKWYVDSVNYAALPAWAAAQTYAAGTFLRSASGTAANKRVYVCTVGALSAGADPLTTYTRGAKRTGTGTDEWIECTGQPAVNKDTTNALAWVAARAYSVGEIVKNGTTSYHICQVAGTSHATTEPTWNTTAGNTNTDDASLIWVCIGAQSAMTLWGAPFSHLENVFGTNWAAANATVHVASSHSQTESSCTITAASGANITCTAKTSAPPASGDEVTAATALVATSTSGLLQIDGSANFRGIDFLAGSGANNANLQLATAASYNQQFDTCLFRCGGTGATSQIRTSATANYTTFQRFLNCGFKFAAAGHLWQINTGKVELFGCRAVSGTSPTIFMSLTTNAPSEVICDGFDASAWSSGVKLTDLAASTHRSNVVFRNTKVPTSWAGTSLSNTALSAPSQRAEIWNWDQDGGGKGYQFRVESGAGIVIPETTIVRTSPAGMTDGTTPTSWKMATRSGTLYPRNVLRSPEIFKYNTTVAGTLTISVDVVHDSQGSGTSSALTDREAWLEVQYLGSSGEPLGLFLTDIAGASTTNPWGNYITTVADQASSGSTWTTTGLATPVTQTLSVTISPVVAGYILARVVLAGVSDTVYVNPKLDIT